jgi:Fe-S cluster assembly iron-binding protein IscA
MPQMSSRSWPFLRDGVGGAVTETASSAVAWRVTCVSSGPVPSAEHEARPSVVDQARGSRSGWFDLPWPGRENGCAAAQGTGYRNGGWPGAGAAAGRDLRARCPAAGHGAARNTTVGHPRIRREEFGMLTLTDQAVAVIRDLTTQPGLPTETGLRIARQDGGAGGLALSLAQGPQAGDQVIEDAGVQIYVQPDAAAALDDKALDARVNETGEVSFQLQPRL